MGVALSEEDACAQLGRWRFSGGRFDGRSDLFFACTAQRTAPDGLRDHRLMHQYRVGITPCLSVSELYRQHTLAAPDRLYPVNAGACKRFLSDVTTAKDYWLIGLPDYRINNIILLYRS